MEATTTTRRRTVRPMSYYVEMLQDLDDSQKLELVSIIIDSVRKQVKAEAHNDEEYSLRPYTMAEIDTMLDEAEAAFEAGDYLTQDEVFHHHETVAV